MINSFDIVAAFGNKVECCFKKVSRCFDNVAGVDGALFCDPGLYGSTSCCKSD